MSEHSPLPWKKSNMWTASIEDAVGHLVVSNIKTADLTIAVHRVNAFPVLVAALGDLVDWLEDNKMTIDGEFSMDELLADGRAALALAAPPEPTT